MDKYFITEEIRVGTVPRKANPYIPIVIVGYGKHSWREEVEILMSKDYSPLSEVRVKHFDSNKDYNQYIKKMQKLGTRIEYERNDF